MLQKYRRLNLNRFTVSTLIVLVAAIAGSIVMIAQHKPTDAAPSVKPGVGAAVPSKFSFSGVMGWWQGATRETDMALFHTCDSCFTSVQYYTGSVDLNAELQKLTVSQADGSDGGISTPSAVVPMTLQTTSGPQQYQLHQFSLTPPAGEKLLRGLEFGYVQLPGSYIKIEGHCDTVEQLTATIPALQAIQFDQSK